MQLGTTGATIPAAQGLGNVGNKLDASGNLVTLGATTPAATGLGNVGNTLNSSGALVPLNGSTGGYQPTNNINASALGGAQQLSVPSTKPSTTAAGISGTADALVSQTQAKVAQDQSNVDQSKTALSDLGNQIAGVQSSQLQMETDAGLPQKQEAATKAANALDTSRQAQTNEIAALDKQLLTPQEKINATNEINHRYALDQANQSVILSAANRDYTTAASIIQHKIDLQLAPLQTKKDFLTTFYNDNKDLLSKAEQNQFSALTTQATQTYETAKTQLTQMADIQKLAIQHGAGEDTAAMAAMNAAKTPGEMATAAGKYAEDNKFTTTTDAYGNPVAFNTRTGQFGSSGGGYGPSPVGKSSNTPGGTTNSPCTATGTGPNGLSFSQYGLLANTDFNPKDQTDQIAQLYLDKYIKSGTVPTASTLGRAIKPTMLAQVAQRAGDLYFKATGNPLPNPDVIKSQQDILESNLKLANNLKIQEQTVSSNVDFSLDNMKKNDLNSSGFKPLDAAINSVADMFNDPHVGQLIAQNSTIQNELGSLLAVKNASGTTVYDKLTSAGIITSSDNPASVKSKVSALLTEAANFADSLKSANADIYKQIDPLMQDSNNPLRAQMENNSVVEKAVNSSGMKYEDIIARVPAGEIGIVDKKTGQVGSIKPSEFDPAKYTKL